MFEETGIPGDNLNFITNFDFIIGNTYHRIGATYSIKIKNNTKIKLKEHEEFKWFKIEELPNNSLPGAYIEAYKLLFSD